MTEPFLCPGWALPKPGTPYRRQKLTNIATRIGPEGAWRICYHLRDPFFRRGDRNILSEGMSNGQNIDTAAEYSLGVGVCINSFRNLGDADGDGYNRGGVITRPQWLRDYTLGCLEAHAEKGVNVKFVQWPNEGDYNPDEHDWEDYLERMVEGTRVVAAAAREVYPDVQIISGGQVLAPTTHSGRKTLAQKFLEVGLYDELDMWANGHSNGKSIDEFVEEIEWARDHGLIVANTEGRNVNGAPTSNNVARYLAFKAEGVRCYGLFIQRDVNAAGDNPGCGWGTGSQKPNRDSGCCFHCSHPPEGLPNPVEWSIFTELAMEAGVEFDPADDLPMDGTEPPVEPPVDPPVPMLDQAWDAYCWLQKEHNDAVGLNANINVYKGDAEARGRFDTFTDRLGKHYEEQRQKDMHERLRQACLEANQGEEIPGGGE